MIPGWYRAGATAAALAALLALAASACGGGRGSRTERGPGGTQSGSGGAPGAGGVPESDGTGGVIADNVRDIQVLFPSEGDEQLHAEPRRILWTASVEDRARQALAELIAGPKSGLLAVLPAGTRLREFFLMPDGTGFADFSAEVRDGPGGTTGERMTLQAIAHTLADNFPEIRRVVILVDGEETETLAGHLDLRYPVVPDPALLASSAAAPPAAPPVSPDGEGTARPPATGSENAEGAGTSPPKPPDEVIP